MLTTQQQKSRNFVAACNKRRAGVPTVQAAIDARAEAERKAWDSLARYKFVMAGYHAGQWVLLNGVLRAPHRRTDNPWSGLVRIARQVMLDRYGVTIK